MHTVMLLEQIRETRVIHLQARVYDTQLKATLDLCPRLNYGH